MPVLRAKDFTPSVPMTLTLRSIEPKAAPDNGFKPAMVYDTSLGSLYLETDPARDVYEQLRAVHVVPNEPVQIVKIPTSHGGHRWHVQRPHDLQRQLEDSIPAARAAREVLAEATAALRPIRANENRTAANAAYQRGAASAIQPAPAAFREVRASVVPPAAVHDHSPVTNKMCAAMMAAVDAVLETQAYATRKGLGLTFSEESVRCVGLSIYIGMQREGGRA